MTPPAADPSDALEQRPGRQAANENHPHSFAATQILNTALWLACPVFWVAAIWAITR